jgi:protein TonB
MLISEFDLYKGEWLSLVFKNRNQKYGAYQLRSHYSIGLSKAMLLTFMAVSSLGIAETIISRNRPIVEQTKTVIFDTDKKVYIMPDKPKEQPKQAETKHNEPVTPPAKAPAVSMVNLNMKPTEDNLVKDEPKPMPANAVSGPIDVIVEGSKGVDNPPMGTESGTGTSTAPPEDNSTHTIGDDLQVMPEPYGGANAWNKFLQKNMRYPVIAQENGLSGKVFLSFIIEKDGHLSDITVLRKVGSGFDEEALRVLKLAPAWKPGMQNGRPVRVKYTIPINFQLNDQ